mgnify:CR=1 FL=1
MASPVLHGNIGQRRAYLPEAVGHGGGEVCGLGAGGALRGVVVVEGVGLRELRDRGGTRRGRQRRRRVVRERVAEIEATLTGRSSREARR